MGRGGKPDRAALHCLSSLGKQLQILLRWVPWGLPALPLPQASLELLILGTELLFHTLGTSPPVVNVDS